MGSEAEKQNRKLSVRNLVEFVLRSGDLDNRRTSLAEKDAMQAGSRIHRKIQKQMGANYQAEVTMHHVVEENEFILLIEGRADGIIEEETEIIIDEIKGVYLDVSYFKEPVPVHLAQVMCYGYFYCFDHQQSQVTLQLTYCNIETEEIRRFQVVKTYEELEEWFACLIREYIKWERYLYEHEVRRDASLRELLFPYPYRAGQKELAVSVYRAIARGKNLCIQAPTGVGKTLSTIYPGLKAMGEGHVEKLFYLTAKTITRSVAEETFEILRGKGLYLKTVTITAKEKLCILDKPECNPDSCPYAKGHFDRINGAVYEIIHREFGITRETVLRYAEEYQVCPFEFCLDISNWVDAVICDYNYVFDPNISLKRYFSEGILGEYLFLVDEAHNLVSRARQMYSAGIVKEDVLLMKRILKSRSPKITRLLERCNKILLEMKRATSDYEIQTSINHFVTALMSMFGELEVYIEENPEFPDRDQVLEFYFCVRNFLNIFEQVDEHYRMYTKMEENGTFLLRLFCVNPARNLQECLKKGRSTIFFSATLLPVLYYKELLSGNLEDYAIYVPSPFPQENRLLLIGSDVSSRYTRRNQREYERIAEYIRQMAAAKAGNYMVFFPSYPYMKAVENCLNEEPFEWIVQESHMSEQEKEDFLEVFHQKTEDRMDERKEKQTENCQKKSLVAFCVMGGIFSEGIDLKGDQLIGAIIVGTGLPMVCTEQTILKDYFDQKQKRGFDFAYQYPGMNKVMQAAGRVIRTMEDRGVILLLDERFLRRDYQMLFPREWNDFEVTTVQALEEKLWKFWGQ